MIKSNFHGESGEEILDKVIKGKAYVLGNNIDTDQIIPAKRLVYKVDDPQEVKLYGKYALSGLPAEVAGDNPFIKEGADVSEYTVIVAGKNFGCGSSREHAPLALYYAGISAVVAEDYARIFYRNTIDGGFVVPFETPLPICGEFTTGDDVELDTEKNLLSNKTTGKSYQLNDLGDIREIVEAGDIFSYAKKKGLA